MSFYHRRGKHSMLSEIIEFTHTSGPAGLPFSLKHWKIKAGFVIFYLFSLPLCYFPCSLVPLPVSLHFVFFPNDRLSSFFLLTVHRKNTWEQVANRYFAILDCINSSQEFPIERDCWVNKSIILEANRDLQNGVRVFFLLVKNYKQC